MRRSRDTDPLLQLRRLGRLYRIQTQYRDMRGHRKEPRPEALLAALAALGAPVDGLGDVAEALRLFRQATWLRALEPVGVAWDGNGRVDLRLPASASEGSLDCAIDLEDGSRRSWRQPIAELDWLQSAEVEGRRFEARRMTLPERLPWGYHRLSVRGAIDAEAAVVAAPRHAYQPAPGELHGPWGVFVPLYALHSERSWGAGDFTDLENFRDWTFHRGGGIVSTLPFLASFLDEPFDPSPYAPASRLFWNELYVDPLRAPQWGSCARARELFSSTELQSEIAHLRADDWVDYRRQMALKRRVLEPLAARAFEEEKGRAAVESFARAREELLAYARFRAAVERARAPWPDWPSPQRDGTLAGSDYDERNAWYHLYVQWLAEMQLRSFSETAKKEGVGLYLDVPLGVHPQSFDVWREQALFARNVSVGAPPDPVFTSGQDWGFPPLLPERSRERRHRYFASALRNQLRHAGSIRIDHVMGLHRLFWIPRGIDAREGVYVRYPAEELYAVVTLESHRERCAIVGENLGIVPPYVNRAMDRHKLRQIYVLQYSFTGDPARPLHPVPEGAVASLNTHDTPTFAGFCEERDLAHRISLGIASAAEASEEREARRRGLAAFVQWVEQGGGTTEAGRDLRALLRAALLEMARSPAGLVLVNLEDLWLETEPQNLPGSPPSHPNWRRKTARRLEEIAADPTIAEILKAIDRVVRER